MFLDHAEEWLLQREAESNVLLGVAECLLRNDHSWASPIYLATVDVDKQVAGCVWRTPPYKLGLTRLPEGAIPLLARDLADVYSDLSAALGPEDEATEFAEIWTRERGLKWSLGTRQRIFSLERVIGPKTLASGTLRRAGAADLSLAVEWGAGFGRDIHMGSFDPVEQSEHLIRKGSLYLWEDRGFRSMAAAVGSTPNGMRIGYVYTPPPFRGRGYATATVASLSQLLLDEGRRFCFLFTDLANPISNAIYQRIGYQAVADVTDVHFC